MKTVILCGGLGTRLREETEHRPKPLVEIGGRPILWHIMKIYAAHGFKDFILCLGYKGNMIKQYFLNYEAMNNDLEITLGSSRIRLLEKNGEHDYKISLVDTGLETMTGGRIKWIEKYVPDDTFMVTYGDGVGDIDIRQLTRFHKSHGGIATLTAVNPVSRFGVLNLSDRKVVKFEEKPRLDGWVNAGFYVFNKDIFDYLDDNCVLERDPLETLSILGSLHAYTHKGCFYTMDTYRDFLELNKIWNSNEAAWKIW